MERTSRTQILKQALSQRILVLDGAMGTSIQKQGLTAEDFGGADREGCNEVLVITRPDVISTIHGSYLHAGCDIIETCTFGATPLVLAEYGLEDKTYEINLTAAKLARQVAARFDTQERLRFVAGSMGPTTKSLSLMPDITFEQLEESFFQQARGLYEGGVDYFLLETFHDTRNLKAALNAIDRLFSQTPDEIPIAVSCTIEHSGTMLTGQNIEAFLTSIEHRELLYVGLNCATGPALMASHLRALNRLSRFPIACAPNAGIPDESGHYQETPETLAATLREFINNGWLNVMGGCCGTTPEHIRALSTLATHAKPRIPEVMPRSALSGIDYLEVTDESRPILVGERANVIGSRKFKTLITEGKFDEAAEVAKAQVRGGAQVVDVCLANPERNELEDIRTFLNILIRKIRVPLMIDSTDEHVIEQALTFSIGKAIINSINLEDGGTRFDRIIPLARKFGAALVVGTIDDNPEQGMGITRERKLQIAERAYPILTDKYGVPPEDIYWDPLVFPCGTGSAEYAGSARETIEAIRLLKERFPGTRSILGISNVSFGLPPAGREVLNSLFLHHCVKNGLDLAIVNTEKLIRFPSISQNEIALAEAVLFRGDNDSIAAFVDHFQKRRSSDATSPSVHKPAETLTSLERLSRHVIDATKDGLDEDLKQCLQQMSPLSIINGPLMAGMHEVGKQFNANRLIVSEVLQSAEIMKTAITYLEPLLESTGVATLSRGRILLATVKGDVHDIGKNLVNMILSNNGFEVIDLGIKVTSEQLIQAVHQYQPDIIGLSGLLVRSAHQMAATAEDLARANIEIPILVGGAAISSAFVDRLIAPAYRGLVVHAKDAMDGLELVKAILDPDRRHQLQTRLEVQRNTLRKTVIQSLAQQNRSMQRSSCVRMLEELPRPKNLERRIVRGTPLSTISRYINPIMLYGRHLGIDSQTVRHLMAATTEAQLTKIEHEKPRAVAIWRSVQDFQKEFENSGILQPSAVYQFFRVSADGNRMVVYSSPNKNQTFEFLRQEGQDGLCLTDYLQKDDTLAMFVVSVGKGVRETAKKLQNEGQYLKSHVLQSLALSFAEGYAEYTHALIREEWGFPDSPRGKRYSFGYPACPNLEDQKLLWELLKPEEIGVQLTEGMMMDPEASVSAIVFHHPQAEYFSVGVPAPSPAILADTDDR